MATSRSPWPGTPDSMMRSYAAAACVVLACAAVASCTPSGRSFSGKRGPLVTLKPGHIETATAVTFEYKSERLRPEALPLLDEVAVTILKAPQVKRVRIEGHTDEVGGREYNIDLSRRRAEVVKRYLVTK